MRHNDAVTSYRIAEAAELLGVSDDTVRRWVDSGRVTAEQVEGRTRSPAPTWPRSRSRSPTHPERERTRARSVSARNRLTGIVTKVVDDTVMAQVEMICGPYRMVSLMSAEAAPRARPRARGPGIVSVKSTNVVVERP